MLQVEAVSSATTSEAPECHYPPRLKGKGQRSPRPMKECHSPLKAEHVGSETKLFSAPRETGKQFHSLSNTYCIPPGTKPQAMSQRMASVCVGEELQEHRAPRAWSGAAGPEDIPSEGLAPAARAQLLKEPFRRELT